MRRLTGAWQRLRALYARDAIEDEIDREVRLHVDLIADECERAGMSPEKARRAALRRFGNVRAVAERGLDVRGAGVLEQMLLDLKHTVRGLARNRTFAVAVTLTLALALGAHTAVFAVVHSVLLQWPYPHADRLVSIRTMRMGAGELPPSIPEYAEWKSSSATFETLEAYAMPRGGFFGDSQPTPAAIRVTSGLLDLLGVRPAVGRVLQEDDFLPGAPPVAVLSHQTWMGRFGGDPDVVGRAIDMGETTHTVAGVAEPLRGPLLANVDAPAFVPWLEGPQLRAPGPPSLLARLRQGATVVQAQAEIAAMGWPSPPSAELLIDATVSRVRPTLLALLGATGLILLIAVSNVANLFLARSTAH